MHPNLTSKVAAAFAAACLVASTLAVAVAATPAAALSESKITFAAREGSTFKKSYGPIAPNDPAGEFHTPGNCASVPFCVEIPLEITLPEGYDPYFDEFVVPITLSWSQDGPSAENDLDMFIYHAEPDEDGDYVEAQSAATSSQPEVAKMFQPDRGNYIICISNFAGINQGFTLEFAYVSYRIDVPDEEDFFGVDPSGGSGGATERVPGRGPSPASPGRTPSSPAFLPSSAPEIGPGPSALAPITPIDNGLPGFGGARDFEDVLGGDDTESAIDILAASRRSLGPPEPVSGATVAFWVGFVPAALAGAIILYLLRRRPAALTIAAPA